MTKCSIRLSLMLAVWTAAFASAQTPLGAAFTYQGQLKEAGTPLNDTTDFEFTLWDDPAAGNPVGSPVAVNNVPVVDGLFTVGLDFGAAAFDGGARWLQIAVRSPAGGGPFTTLSPRQALTAAPYASFAGAPWVTSGPNISYTAGNVGVGTSTPGVKLHVVADGFGIQHFSSDGLSDVSTYADASGGWIGTANNKPLLFFTNNSWAQMVLQPDGQVGVGGNFSAAGNVGIGTDAPSTKLHLRNWLGGENDAAALFDIGNCGAPCGQEEYSEAVRLLNSNGNGQVGLGFLVDSTSTIETVPNVWLGTDYGAGGQANDFVLATRTSEGALAKRVVVDGATGNADFSGILSLGGDPGNPWLYSNYLGINGRQDGGPGTYPGSAGIVIGDPVTSRYWTFGQNTDGGFSFQKFAGDNSRNEVQAPGNLSAGGNSGNPFLYSTYVGIRGRQDGGPGTYPGAAGVVVHNPINSSSWAFGINTNGAFSFQKFGAGPAEVQVPVLRIAGGADIVEGFETAGEKALEPGTVVVIDPGNPGKLMCASEAYDAKVAGVVSGAGGVSAGLKLGQEGVLDGDVPVSMTGRVYVKCSTENGAIRPGDRLTTATLPGHAMKATDPARCDGAVMGKAMSGLDAETGLVLVLVNLQ